jgi:nicotinamidase-related amidase
MKGGTDAFAEPAVGSVAAAKRAAATRHRGQPSAADDSIRGRSAAAVSQAMKRDQPRTLVIVIDPQKAFAHPDGSLARAYGCDEIQRGIEALAGLHRFLGECPPSFEAGLVRSEYRPGQFAGGRLDHPLTNLCVPAANVDCEWADGLDVGRASWVVTKRQADAMDSSEYRNLVEHSIARGVTTVCVAGFQLTTCVRATALAMTATYRSRGVRVAVLKWLTGARASSYRSDRESRSRVEETCGELTASGVEVMHQASDFAGARSITGARRRRPGAARSRLSG